MKPTILILSILVIAMSCRKKEVANSAATYHPLKIGNTWTYKVTKIDSTRFPTPLYSVDTVVIECSATTIIEGNTYYTMTTQGSTGANIFRHGHNFRWEGNVCYSYYNSHDYAYVNGSPNYTFNERKEVPYLLKDMQVGDYWGWTQPYRSYSYVVTAADTSMNILNNVYGEVTHTTLDYYGGGTSTIDAHTTDNYYQYEVGLIKQVYVEHQPVTVKSIAELISYSVQ